MQTGAQPVHGVGAAYKWVTKDDQASIGPTTKSKMKCANSVRGSRKYCRITDWSLQTDDHAPVTTWYVWVYGAKLWKDQTIQDPELLKLTDFFKTLREVYDPGDWSDSES